MISARILAGYHLIVSTERPMLEAPLAMEIGNYLCRLGNRKSKIGNDFRFCSPNLNQNVTATLLQLYSLFKSTNQGGCVCQFCCKILCTSGNDAASCPSYTPVQLIFCHCFYPAIYCTSHQEKCP